MTTEGGAADVRHDEPKAKEFTLRRPRDAAKVHVRRRAPEMPTGRCALSACDGCAMRGPLAESRREDPRRKWRAAAIAAAAATIQQVFVNRLRSPAANPARDRRAVNHVP
ncbi:hypothetical protein K32_11430 [Kaistia sp. 32K]|nr:hypothetical protein K32_11430 [Kaistia sp. 32K]